MMTLVHFPQAPDAHPTAHVPPIGAAVEAFFVHRDLAPNSRRVYRAALDPLWRLSVPTSPSQRSPPQP